MLNDRYGNPVSTSSHAAVAHYDEALDLIRLYRGDPVGALDAALAEDPEFGSAWAARAGLLVQQTDKALADEVDKSLRAGAVSRLSNRDQIHLAAARDWSDGYYLDGTRRLASLAREMPRDLLAVQLAHTGCFFPGHANRAARRAGSIPSCVPARRGWLWRPHGHGLFRI